MRTNDTGIEGVRNSGDRGSCVAVSVSPVAATVNEEEGILPTVEKEDTSVARRTTTTVVVKRSEKEQFAVAQEGII